MFIAGVAACAAGIAHTYIAKEKLINAAEKYGHTIKVETQGTIGTQDALTPEDIEKADVIVLAVDIEITGKERFKGKKLVEVPISVAVKNSDALIRKLAEKLES